MAMPPLQTSTANPVIRFLTPHRIRQAGYAPLLAAGMGVMFVRLLVMARLLDIEQFAVLSAGLVVSSLISTFSCFGLFLHLQRKLPVHLARRHHRAAAVQLSQTVIAALAIGGVGMAVGLSGASIGGVTSDMILFGSVHGVSQQLFMIATTESRSDNDPIRYSLQHLVRSTATVLLAVPAAVLLGSAEAVLIAETAVAVAAVLIILATVARRLNASAPRAAALGIRSFGRVDWISMLSLLTYSIIAAISVQADRWISSVSLSPIDFAHYSFAWIIMIFALSAQALINASVYPMIARRFALAGASSAYRLAALASSATLVVCAILIVPSVLVANSVIGRFFPGYEDAATLVPILAAAGIFRVSDFWSTFLIVAGRERSALLATVVSLTVTFALWYLAIEREQLRPVHLAYLALSIAAVTYVVAFAMCWYARKRQVLGTG